MSSAEKETDMKGSRTMSKKKYYEIVDALSKIYTENEVERITGVIREVMRFDPTVTLYDEKAKESIKARRERLKSQGISTYESSGAKAYYHKNKNNKTT